MATLLPVDAHEAARTDALEGGGRDDEDRGRHLEVNASFRRENRPPPPSWDVPT